MIRSTIEIEGDEILAALLASEEATFRHARATYQLRRSASTLRIVIEAKDASALKATVSSICRVLAVQEKARGV